MQPSLRTTFRTYPHPGKTLIHIYCQSPFSSFRLAFSRQKTRRSFLPEIERARPWAGLLSCLCQVPGPYKEHWWLMSCDALFPIRPLPTLPNFFFFHFSHLFCCAQHVITSRIALYQFFQYSRSAMYMQFPPPMISSPTFPHLRHPAI